MKSRIEKIRVDDILPFPVCFNTKSMAFEEHEDGHKGCLFVAAAGTITARQAVGKAIDIFAKWKEETGIRISRQ